MGWDRGCEGETTEHVVSGSNRDTSRIERPRETHDRIQIAAGPSSSFWPAPCRQSAVARASRNRNSLQHVAPFQARAQRFGYAPTGQHRPAHPPRREVHAFGEAVPLLRRPATVPAPPDRREAVRAAGSVGRRNAAVLGKKSSGSAPNYSAPARHLFSECAVRKPAVRNGQGGTHIGYGQISIAGRHRHAG